MHAQAAERRVPRFRWGCILPLVLAAACGFPLAPVSEQGTSLRQPAGVYREVAAGDTLYSISWESGRDYRDVARWNNISPPYVIMPGQRLRLYPPAAAARSHRPAPHPSPAPERTTAGKKSAPAKPATPSPRVPSAGVRHLTWIWPTQGTILERYSANGTNKGLDIAGSRGQPILAAAGGRVVYEGGGLRGYGQLIIIKHDADFLSAYAHCDKIYVKEGDVIKRGQKIAGMGSSGAERVKLHFEIRYRGAPVDPQDYLPRK